MEIDKTHHEEIEENYLERLAENWPEPREQMHHGGWSATDEMFDLMNIDQHSRLLDLCCGEGGTALWAAQKYGVRVTGIDILKPAIDIAKKKAEEKGISDKVSFIAEDIFSLPFENNSFDVIYGQDPDGIANFQREIIFKECKRVLRKKGQFIFQLWLPAPGTPKDVIKKFEDATAGSGYASMRRISTEDFAADLESAGFEIITIDDMSSVYEKHIRGIAANFKNKKKEPDTWTKMLLELFDAGHKVGVRINTRS